MSADPVKERLCPCGCGDFLAIYRGKRPLCCAKAWKRLPMHLRMQWHDARSSEEAKRTAARSILETIRSWKPQDTQTEFAL